MTLVVLKIKWWNGTERICFDTSNVETAKRISTEEIWTENDKLVHYRPRCEYVLNKAGNHVIILRYLAKDHPNLTNLDIVWGTARIELDSSFSKGTAIWKSAPENPEYDGKVKVAVWKEANGKRDHQKVQRMKRAQQFKAELMRRGEACAILNKQPKEVLDAVHIQDVEDGGPDIPENGLLLRTDLHRLFDAGLFSIKSTGQISVSRHLSVEYRQLLKGRRISKETMSRISHFLPKRSRRSSTK